ncbi:hypothetical protein [Salimicrobium halophilum]|nr:hypothetical protein [Salimicrobium halophilum]
MKNRLNFFVIFLFTPEDFMDYSGGTVNRFPLLSVVEAEPVIIE